jgi:hypothetical protein
MALESISILPSPACDGNPEPEPFCGLLVFARELHAYRVAHDQKYRLEPARIRLEEERAEAARQALVEEASE